MKLSMSWSGGKDSAFALYKLLQSGEHEVAHLHCLIREDSGRVGLHETPLELIRAQAGAIGLPLRELYLPAEGSNRSYEQTMLDFTSRCIAEGIEAFAYGDIFLQDLKEYREMMLAKAGLKGVFPLWQQDTTVLLQQFISAGFKTCICAVDEEHLRADNLGLTIDADWVQSLKEATDPCGENGEFHTFTFDGPLFNKPVCFEKRSTFSRSFPAPDVNEKDRNSVKVFHFLETKPCG